jgi:hypothetical protein
LQANISTSYSKYSLPAFYTLGWFSCLILHEIIASLRFDFENISCLLSTPLLVLLSDLAGYHLFVNIPWLLSSFILLVPLYDLADKYFL